MEFNKVFCIGLNKTGTTSLHDAFKILGLSSVHYTDGLNRNIQDVIWENHMAGRGILDSLEQYDAISDWVRGDAPHLYREFDAQYPNSKFILHTRNMEDWLDSREKHVKRHIKLYEETKDPLITWRTIDREGWTTEYVSHHADVTAHFKGRSNDLLVMDVTKGDGWEKLCPFLGMAVPQVPFPVANAAPTKAAASAPAVKPGSLLKRLFG